MTQAIQCFQISLHNLHGIGVMTLFFEYGKQTLFTIKESRRIYDWNIANRKTKKKNHKMIDIHLNTRFWDRLLPKVKDNKRF